MRFSKLTVSQLEKKKENLPGKADQEKKKRRKKTKNIRNAKGM